MKTEVTIGRGYPCVVNDEILVKQATALAKAEKLKVEMLPLRTTAEDFGFYCKQYPSLFYRLGVGAAAGRPHTATFFPTKRLSAWASPTCGNWPCNSWKNNARFRKTHTGRPRQRQNGHNGNPTEDRSPANF